MGNSNMKPVLVTTEYRGVFFGYVPEDQDMSATSMPLKGARMAIYWATKNGIAELADVGPNIESRIGSQADIEILHKIAAIWAVKKEAEQAWLSA